MKLNRIIEGLLMLSQKLGDDVDIDDVWVSENELKRLVLTGRVNGKPKDLELRWDSES